jgi:hypothetical protein
LSSYLLKRDVGIGHLLPTYSTSLIERGFDEIGEIAAGNMRRAAFYSTS